MTKTPRTHKLLDRPLLGTFSLIGFLVLLMSIPQTLEAILGWDETPAGYLLTMVAIAPTLLAAEFVFTNVWFRGKFDGTLGRERLLDGLKLTIPVAALNILLFLADRLVLATNAPMNNVLMVLAISLNAGFLEEAWFRSYTVSNLMRIKRSYGGMIFAVVLTALLFGSTHLGNILVGGNVSRTIQQFVTSSITGLFYAAIYLHCGTILPCMLYHSFHDIINLLFMATNSSGVMVNAATTGELIAQVLYSGTQIVLALWFLRPAAFEGIRKLWDRKWKLGQHAEGHRRG